MRPMLEVKDLWVAYERPVLKGINMAIAEGERVVLLGPNGSGKTTLLKAILGLVKPKGGLVKIFGNSVEDVRHETRVSTNLEDQASRARTSSRGYIGFP